MFGIFNFLGTDKRDQRLMPVEMHNRAPLRREDAFLASPNSLIVFVKNDKGVVIH